MPAFSGLHAAVASLKCSIKTYCRGRGQLRAFLMVLSGWGWFIYLCMNRICSRYLQCAVQESKVLPPIHDWMGHQKCCWAIKNNLNHHRLSCCHFVSEVWRWLTCSRWISLAHSSTGTRLSWGEPPTPAASEHTCQATRGVESQRAAPLQHPPDKQSNARKMNCWVGNELYILLYIKTQLSELTITLQREPAIMSLRTRTSAEIIDDCGW